MENIPSKGQSTYKGPEVKVGIKMFKALKMASLAGIEQRTSRVTNLEGQLGLGVC